MQSAQHGHGLVDVRGLLPHRADGVRVDAREPRPEERQLIRVLQLDLVAPLLLGGLGPLRHADQRQRWQSSMAAFLLTVTLVGTFGTRLACEPRFTRPSLHLRAVSRNDDGFGGERNRLLSRLVACDSGEAVSEVLELLRESGMGPDVESYSAGIARCSALPGGADWAFLLLDEMRALGLEPSAACLSGALTAAIAAGQREPIEQLLAGVGADGVQLDTADTCAAISAVHALSEGDQSFGESRAGRLWTQAVLPGLLGESGRLLTLTGCSARLAVGAVRSVLGRLVERQLELGPGSSALEGGLRLRFGPARPSARGQPAANGKGEEEVLLAVERALGTESADWPAVPCARKRAQVDGLAAQGAGKREASPGGHEAGGGAPLGSPPSTAAGWDLVISEAALKGWVLASCVKVWLAATDDAIVAPALLRRPPAAATAAASSEPVRAATVGSGARQRATRATAASPGTEASTRDDAPIGMVKGVGEKRQEQLSAVGLTTVGQLARLMDGDLPTLAAQSGCPAGMLAKYMAEARRMLAGARSHF